MKPVGNEFQSHLNAVKIESEHNFREHITVSKSKTSLLFETRKCCSKTKLFHLHNSQNYQYDDEF